MLKEIYCTLKTYQQLKGIESYIVFISDVICVLPIKSSSNTFLCVITPQIMGPVCKSTNHIISQILHQTCQGLWMVEAELRLEATVEEATEGQVGQLTFGRFSCEKLISALSYPDHCMPRCLLACFFFTFCRFSYDHLTIDLK